MAQEPESAVSIEVKNLVKRYPKAPVNAVDDISYTGYRLGVVGFGCNHRRFLYPGDKNVPQSCSHVG